MTVANLQPTHTMAPSEETTEAVGIWTAIGVSVVVGLLIAVPFAWAAREALLALGVAQ